MRKFFLQLPRHLRVIQASGNNRRTRAGSVVLNIDLLDFVGCLSIHIDFCDASGRANKAPLTIPMVWS